jgi:hypothetical protein
LNESFDYADDLRASLALAENNFRKADSRRARMIYTRKTDVFEVKILYPRHCRGGFEFTALVGIEQLRQFA